MKKYFQKAMTVAGSALMITSTVALAAAASFPQPFVQSGAADVAIVVGSGAALSDGVAASKISSELATELAAQTASGSTTSGTTVSGGDSHKFEKSSTKFGLGKGILDIDATDVNDDDLPTLLADGVFTDDDNDEFDFTQKVEMTNLTLTMFEDNDYKADEPTVGIKITNGANVLNYTLDFTDEPLWSDLETSDITIMGKPYYVLDTASANNSLTLLDSANNAIVSEGESITVTVGDTSYDVTVDFIGSNEVVLQVDGALTNTLNEGETQKLSDGSYIGIKDILYNTKDSGISKVEFSLGKGKLVIETGTDIEMNDETVSDVSAVITNSGTGSTTKLSSLKIVWDADDDLFVTEDSSPSMPGFEALKLTFAGLVIPTEETFTVEADGDSVVLKNFPLKDGVEDINILIWDDTNNSYYGIGRDVDERLITGNYSNASVILFDGDTDAQFVASWNDGDDSESYLMRLSDWKNSSSKQMVTVQYKVGGTVDETGTWTDVKKDAESGDTVTLGNVELTVNGLNKDQKNSTIIGGSGVSFNTLYSAEGLKVWLPYYATNTSTAPGAINFTQSSKTTNNGTLGHNVTSFYLSMEEEDKDGDLAAGGSINLTVSSAGTNVEPSIENVAVSSATRATRKEIGDSDNYLSYLYTALATKITEDESDDQEKVTVVYHGDEVYGEVFLSAPSASVLSGSTSSGSATSLGSVTVTDSEAASVSGKNLIVVGGSCINSVAADLLGSAACEADFTAATGVSAGEALIKSFDRSGKVAVLIAGYNAADTEKAVTYALNNDWDSSDVNVKVTSATSAEAIVA